MLHGAAKQLPWILITAALTATATLATQTSLAKAGPELAPGACRQWQTATLPLVIDINAPLPEMGKPRIDTAPEGWEPFALGHGGMLIYRRCLK